MVKRLKQSLEGLKNPLRFWLLVGASSFLLVCALLTLSTHTVQADTQGSQEAVAASVADQASSATPALNAPLDPSALKRFKPAKTLHGIASWYGVPFHGRRAANGETFDMHAMTACHPTLPFGSIVQVKNLENNKSVIVRITDRGLLYEGRVIDLSMAAAAKLNMVQTGLARVDLKVLKLGVESPEHP